MNILKTPNQEELYRLLFQLPPQFEEASCFIHGEKLTAEDVTRVGIQYVKNCFWDYGDSLTDDAWENTFCGNCEKKYTIQSAYLYEITEFLLRYGLEPNAVYDSEYGRYNIMEGILFIDHEYIAADTMRLLMEHGADPNLPIDGETVFERVDFAVWFDAIEQEIRWRYDQWVHIWFVLLAYGGGTEEVRNTIEVFREYGKDELFDLKKLRDHRNYGFCLTWENGDPTIHVFHKDTLWQVAKG